MTTNILLEVELWLLVLFSFALPGAIFAVMLVKRSIARAAVFALGLSLIVIAGVDVYLLQRMSQIATQTPSVIDDAIFISEVTVALYLLPAMIGGIGVNVLSHVLIQHLARAEARFERRDA
jgi:hypothetical protein